MKFLKYTHKFYFSVQYCTLKFKYNYQTISDRSVSKQTLIFKNVLYTVSLLNVREYLKNSNGFVLLRAWSYCILTEVSLKLLAARRKRLSPLRRVLFVLSVWVYCAYKSKFICLYIVSASC